jgi:hypothetical protein
MNLLIEGYKMQIPKFLSHLPVFHGMPVPFTFAWHEGVPDFKVLDLAKVAVCLQNHLCGTCGRKLGVYCYFIGGPASRQNRLFTDPPMHRACAQFSTQVCPFLNGSVQQHSSATPSMPVRIAEHMVHERPSEIFILRGETKRVRLTRMMGRDYITVPNWLGVEVAGEQKAA